MESGKYYVLSDGNNLFEGMTKEEIFAAIVEATGNTPTGIDDAFITKIKEQNQNIPLKFWIGTNAQYNALEEIDPNCFYIFTDTNELDNIEQLAEDAAETKATEICAPLETFINKINDVLYADEGSGIINASIANINNYLIVLVKTGVFPFVVCTVEYNYTNNEAIIKGSYSSTTYDVWINIHISDFVCDRNESIVTAKSTGTATAAEIETIIGVV